MTFDRDKLVGVLGSIPYSLRLVALVLIFNGMFALIKLATILIGIEVEFDWRVVNVIIGYGLLMNQRVFPLVACISVAANVILHLRSIAMVMSKYQVFGASGTLYFVVALALDLGMLYILVHHITLKNHFNLKGKS